jgi:sugar diacid utilization regulator
MAYLSTIIDAIETHFQLEIQGDYYPRDQINGIRFPDKDDTGSTHPEPDILYLADYPSFVSKEPNGKMLYIGCGSSIPSKDCMYIRENPDLFELYNVISDHLTSYRKIHQNSVSLFNNLYAGRGISGLLQTAYGVLNNPLVVLDSIFSTLAYYPDVDEPLFESTNGVLILNHKTLTSMKNSNVLTQIYHSVYPFRTYIDELGYELVFESIRIQRAIVGYLCIRCNNRTLDDNELEYVHSLTQMISIQLHQNDSYQNPYGVKYDLFLKHLFTHHFDTEESARKHVSFLSIQPKKDFYIIASGFREKSSKLMANDYYCHQFSNTFANSITGIMGDRFITLISTDDAPYFTASVLDRFETFLTMNKMKAAISYVFDSLLDAKDFLEQSLSHLNYLLVVTTKSPIGFYSSHYIRHLVELSGSYDLLKTTIHPAILRMDRYDKEHQTSYLETLITYFDQNRSAPDTAKALFIHKSTLFYRFNKMNSLFQIDLEDKDALFAYEFSLHLMEILNARKKET